MLRLHACGGRHRFDRVQPVELLGILAPLGVIAHQLVEARIRRAGKEIRIERDNHIGIGQVVLRGHAALKRRPGNRRIVLRKLRLRPRGLRRLPVPRQRRRSNGRAQEIDTSAIFALDKLFPQSLRKLGPLAILAAIQDMLRAIRIVQVKQRPLRKRIRRSVVIRVLGIAIHLDGTELIALHQQRHRTRHKRVCRSKIHRLAKNQVFRRLDVGINRLVGLLGATGQSCQRQRSAHQLHESAPRNRIDPLLRRAWKLLLHSRLKLRCIGQFVHRPPVLLALHALQFLAYRFK